jgi:hypothetical protein
MELILVESHFSNLSPCQSIGIFAGEILLDGEENIGCKKIGGCPQLKPN